MRAVIRIVLAWLVFLLPAAASAQAVITGTVRDTSGAVLPGVTVEATSPALIEKVRAAVSDGSGQYRIEDLRPGTYTVSFTLTGFSVFKREGIELTGSFTAVVNAEMRLGALEETIVVTGESPVVDVQSARRQMTLGSDVLRSIPTIRNYNGVVLLVPGVVTNTNDVPTGATTTQFPIHGGRNNEGRLMIDGLNIGTPVGGNQPPGYIADIGNAQEITFTTSGGLGESETAGVVMNVVPRTGGNRVSGSVFFSGTGEGLQSSNYTEELRLAGLTAAIPLSKVYDLNGAVGGPIMRDRVWYFVNARTQGSTRGIASVYYNQNTGDATKWLYSPDPRSPGVLRSHLGQRERAHHVAGDATQQDRVLLGRAADLPQLRGHDPGHHRSRPRVARGHRQRLGDVSCSAGHLVVAGDQSFPAGCRHRRQLQRLRAP